MKFDMTTFGETMIRISIRAGKSIANTNEAELYTGGTESNTAVALSRLGLKTAWVSRLTDNSLGRRIEADISRYGVDTSKIIWTKDDRVGSYYVEFAIPPRKISVLYDRKHTAISKLKPDELDWNFLLNTRIIHLTGITPALSSSCKDAVEEAIKRAKRANIPISFDVNYRAKLWKQEEARNTLSPLIQDISLLIMTKDDAETVFNIKGEPDSVIRKIKDLFKPEVAVLTVGAKGALCFDSKKIFSEAGFQLGEVVDRLGAGDAFTAGMIFGFLKEDLELGLKYGVAMSAMKMGMLGDYFWATKEDVEEVIKASSGDIRR